MKCETCGKICYANSGAAERSRKYLAGQGYWHEWEIGIYQCGDYWHLGHLNKEELDKRIAAFNAGSAVVNATGAEKPEDETALFRQEPRPQSVRVTFRKVPFGWQAICEKLGKACMDETLQGAARSLLKWYETQSAT